MEQEIQNVMVIIRKSLESMPEMGTKTWELMVVGERFDGIISIVSLLLFSVLTIFMIKKSINIYNNSPEVDVDEIQMLFFPITGLLTTINLALLFNINDFVRSIILPEYSLIKNIIDSFFY